MTFDVASFIRQNHPGVLHQVIVNPAFSSSSVRRQKLAERNDLITVLLFLSEQPPRVEFYQSGHAIVRCGSGTLAAAHVIYRELGLNIEALSSPGGVLHLRSDKHYLGYAARALFARPSAHQKFWQSLVNQEVLDCQLLGEASDYCLLMLASEKAVGSARVDLESLKQKSGRAVILTAPAEGEQLGYVFRYFAPQYGIDEGEVTGSVNVELGKFWSRRLQDMHSSQSTLIGRQLTSSAAEFRLWTEPPHIWVLGKTRQL